MQVETYEIESVAFGALDMQEEVQQEVKDLIESLELEGQKELFTKKADGTEDIIPYTKLDGTSLTVWSQYCPDKVGVSKYGGGIIPLRVLQIISHAQQMDWFKGMFIWSENEYRIDPILIGKTEKDTYILARWGDALESYEEIVKKAKIKWMEKAKNKLTEQRDEADAALSRLDSIWQKVLHSDWVHEAGITLSSI